MDICKYMNLIAQAEKLKNNTRHSWTSAGRHESVAEHSWRLAFMAYFMKDEFPDIDINKVMLMCIMHDIGEAFTGDIPSFEKTSKDEAAEENVVEKWISEMPEPYNTELGLLFEEMKNRESTEAKLYKALDKMEAVIQYNEADIRTWLPLEYDLQLTYGEAETAFSQATKVLKQRANADTIAKIEKAKLEKKNTEKDKTESAEQGETNKDTFFKTDKGEILKLPENMGIIKLVLGACFTNCYIVYHKITRNCFIIDPADESEKIINAIEENGLHPKYIVITHGHSDHVLAMHALVEKYKIMVMISKIDAWRLLDEDLINERPYVTEPYKPVRASVLLSEDDEIWLDDIGFKIMVVPGHTPGSIALIGENVIFTGDTMLANGHGKTSLPGGDEKEILRSLERIKSLEGNYIIYPGHKESTVI